ncbi:hypothetical protein D3C71_1467590 [compost metagenome]
MNRGISMAHRRPPITCAPSWGALEKRSGSFCEEVNTGNSNRILGLFRGLAKGVK